MYTVIKRGNSFEASTSNVVVMIDNVGDLQSMPKYAAGSVAFLPDLSKFWMIDGHGDWREIQTAN